MCMNCAIQIDQSKSDQFAQQMIGMLNQSALAAMTAVGHRTGLFEAMSRLDASTSQQIADKAGLNERYVREWLGAMVTGHIVDYNPKNKTYHLPAEHAAWLTKDGSGNFGITSQWLHVMSAVEDRVVECFRKGGGLDYSEYKRFNEVMADESGQTVVDPLINAIFPLVPGLTKKLEKGIAVLDVGCGSGRALIKMAQHYPNSNFTGYDLLPTAVKAAEAQAKKLGLKNIRFAAKDVSAFDDKEKFDLICTFDAVHDQAKPAQVLKNIYNALKKGGTYLCQDIAGSSHLEKNMDHPVAPFMYTISTTHCMSVSLGQGGAGLGAMWGKELAVQMFKEAGFDQVEVRNLEHDILNNYYLMAK